MTRPWGSIRIRGGSIALRYRLPSGERVQETLPVGTTKKEAQRRLVDLHHLAIHGTTLRPSSVTVAELLRDYLAADHGWARNSLRQRTQAAARVTACLGAVRLCDLTIGHVEAMQKSLKEGTWRATSGYGSNPDLEGTWTATNVASGAGILRQSTALRAACDAGVHGHGPLSPVTVNMAVDCLSYALSWAMTRKVVNENVASHVRRLTMPRANKKAHNAADAAKLYKTCMAADPAHPQARLVAFLLTTLVRYTEAAGLLWPDLDLEAPRYTINRGWDDAHHAYSTDDNAKHRHRSCRLPAAAVKALERQRKCIGILRERAVAYGAVWTDSEVVFPSLYGRPMPATTLQKALAALCAEAGVPRLSIHELRHTGTSLHIALGTSRHELMEITGWKSMPATYAHLYESDLQRAVDKLGDLLEGVS